MIYRQGLDAVIIRLNLHNAMLYDKVSFFVAPSISTAVEMRDLVGL